MKIKETIAFLGEADIKCSELIQRLAAGNYPVVLVSKESNHFEDLSRQILSQIPEADVEIVGCAREGCWEADIIVLCDNVSIDEGLAAKIKEVANNKTLVYLLEKGKQPSLSAKEIDHFQHSLPNAQWVQLYYDPNTKDFDIAGKKDATDLIENILSGTGNKIRLPETTA